MCGVIGIVADGQAVAEDIYAGLWSLQHRGKESAGIVTYDGTEYFDKKGMGTVEVVFGKNALLNLRGESGIGHVRYSTAGASSLENAQPIEGSFRGIPFWLSHNGNLVGTDGILRELKSRGYVFNTSTDTEIIAALIHFSGKQRFADALKEALSKVAGTFSLVALFKNDVYGVRDSSANLPLGIGLGRGVMVIASESATCDVLGIEFLREVYPGEFVVLSKNTFSLLSDKLSEPFSETIKNQKPCIFEFVYFLRPDSKMNSRRAQLVRKEMGKALWREAPVEADIVISVPDSGNFAAAGVAEEARLPLEDAFFRSHYVGRTFIEPLQERREKGLRIKLNIVPELIAGKRVVVVDDSIVRSTVIKRVVQMLRHAGAKAIHVRISSPPYAFPCYYGKDTYRVKDELIAKRCGGDIEIIRQEIGADSLHYLSLGALKRAVIGASGDLTESNFCDACFSGNYHIPIA